MSLWDNINKKRQRIKQGSGEKMRKKGDKGAPTPDQIKRAKGEDMEEGKMKQAMMRRQDMAKLAGLYSKAMKAMPGSPKQKALKKQIDQYRRELGMDESVSEAKDTFVVYKSSGIGKIKKLATINSMPKGKMLDKVLDKYNADGVMAMSRITRNKVRVHEAVTEAKGKYASDAQMDDFLKGMEKHPDVKKMSKHYNRPVGDIVKALRARVSVNRLRGGNVYTLNFADKDSKLKVKAKKKYAPIKEAVSPAQQAAIAISKKERGEKPKNECASEDDFKPHMMYDPKTGKGVMAKKYADHVRLDKMGYVHDKPEVKESRAYRDAMRGLRSKSATRGMATTKKDKDVEASDDDRKAANKNIIMQLRKAADLPTGANIEFERGKGKVSRAQAQAALARFNALAKPNDKEKFQKSIRSLSDIKKILGR